ncbi:MAG: galactokinase [Deferribacterota bacterium]|nr:galactokinase [Deferribacterota bacterium]
MEKFNQIFSKKNNYIYASSPGRVNLIGEHTDYHKGFVLPFAVSLYVDVLATINNEPIFNIYSANYNETFTFRLSEPMKISTNWSSRAEGIIRDILKNKTNTKGANIVIDGDLPVGKGLSSSAASMAAIGAAIAKINGIYLKQLEFAQILQNAEHIYGGVKCGLMDQLSILFGKENNALLIDCLDNNINFVKIPDNIEFVLIDSGVKHELADSEYNKRQKECNKIIDIVKKVEPNIESFRDISLINIGKVLTQLDSKLFRRIQHVLTENERVLKLKSAFEHNKKKDFSKLLLESHLSLKYNYEVSCYELDTLVENAYKSKHLIGARMTGGGFGGCTINIVKKNKSSELINELQNHIFNFEINKPLWTKVVRPVQGLTVRSLTNE